MFCAEHLSQAQLFSVSFGQTGPDERAEQAESAAEERHTERASADGAADSAPKRSGDRPPVTGESEDQASDVLAEKLHQAFEKIRDRAKESSKRAALRWPQISVYYLHGKLLSRPYYTIVPRAPRESEGEAPAHPDFVITDTVVEKAIVSDGPVFVELAAHFKDCFESLKNRWLRSIDLHFLTYAGLIAINERLPTQEERNLTTFTIDGDRFVSVDAAEVKPRLRHERW